MTVKYADGYKEEVRQCQILKKYPTYTLIRIRGKIGSYNKCFMNCDIGKTVKFCE